MILKTKFFINGIWSTPKSNLQFKITNPATEEFSAVISLGSVQDIDDAVQAARYAFANWREVTVQGRVTLLQRLLKIYQARSAEMAAMISLEMGAPIDLAKNAQTAAGIAHTGQYIESLKSFEFERVVPNNSGDRIFYEPIGVCGLITPWNWPMNQVTLKVIAALSAGCTVVLKPSEIAPLSSMLFAEMVDEAGFPPGVFNLVNGTGVVAGDALAAHSEVDMLSFTGSTRAGIAVSQRAAPTVKRVTLELGGKSPNLVFADTDLEQTIRRGVLHCFNNSGQSCNAPTRMLVQREVYAQAVQIAAQTALDCKVGLPSLKGDHLGPLVSQTQFDRVQALIHVALEEGARLVAGGPGRPDGFSSGYFVRPTVFADVTQTMRIVQEEVFGPVLCIQPFDDEEEAVRLANDTPYGLAAYVQTNDRERALRVTKKLRAGGIHINGVNSSSGTPFGGYKQSGNGREGGKWGLEDFLEVKSVSGI